MRAKEFVRECELRYTQGGYLRAGRPAARPVGDAPSTLDILGSSGRSVLAAPNPRRLDHARLLVSLLDEAATRVAIDPLISKADHVRQRAEGFVIINPRCVDELDPHC